MAHSGTASRPWADDCSGSTIAEMVAQLGELVAEAPQHRGTLVDLVDTLRAKLRTRFIRYDDDLLAEAVFQAPWLTGFAEALRHEHVELLRVLETLRERAARSDEGVAAQRGLEQSYHEFVELLGKHDGGRRNLIYESQLCQGHLHE
ncbi:MAG: hypothetical protein DWQ31_05230 [Planctomycetota bacterium]|nr:MAG: hypothetical protein DWQ31_05230 [Planctomycetota bacterium]REJ97592.1 MAG: hypothetical protein DWQ35_01640 [Planctomycetota bacterium]REK23014.1 MAG: hypothetical protein DWQ42_15940 [Planctomycetota bacterium]REK43377.1 MAG: hypothetical protein DWQ46_11640 [Planctomycetota bacterium]